jgi:hypothetical protein
MAGQLAHGAKAHRATGLVPEAEGGAGVSKTREEYRTANAVGVNLPVCGENEVELQIEAWAETARQQLRNTEYYRGLVVSIGELFGEEARTADDGTVMEDVLCAKVPELVRHLERRLANQQRYIMLLRERLVKVGERVKALRFEAAKIAGDWSIRLAAEELRSARLRAALELIAMGTQTSSGDLAGATWEDLRHVKIARVALAEES